ncbi:cytochrome P450 89A2-like [Triticum urartu]|nr:cytochrome P450 89A2-like [Triticum urartu]
MEFVMLLAVLLCLLAGMVILRSYTRRAHAQATIYHVGDPAVAHRALIGNADEFLNRPAASFPTSLATWRHGERNDNIATVSYGPQWRVLRCNLTAEILSRLGSLAPLHEEAAQALVADLSARCGGGGDVAVREPITKAVFTLATRLCFGDIVDDSQRHAIGRVIRDSIVTAGKLSPGFDGSMLSKLANWRGFRRIYAVLKRQTKLYLPLIAARSQSQSQLCGGIVHPYVDSLLDLRVPEDNGDASGPGRPLRDGELVGLVFEFLGAATGSTAACLEWTLAHLIDQPETLDKLRVEIDEEADAGGILSSKSLRGGMPYLNAVVLECLRMHPPVPVVLRSAHGEGAKAISGMTAVPVDGLNVRFNLADIGRDAKRWTDPDKFRPERFLAGGEAEDIGPAPGPKEIRMMPFGAGHRHCPGVNMGMLHIKCFLAALVHNFDWALSAEDCSSGVDMTEQDGFIKIMKKPLSARVTRRT